MLQFQTHNSRIAVDVEISRKTQQSNVFVSFKQYWEIKLNNS